MEPHRLAFFAAIVASNHEVSPSDEARLVAWVRAAGGEVASVSDALARAREAAISEDPLSFLDGLALSRSDREALIRDGLILAVANGAVSPNERGVVEEAARRLQAEAPAAKLARASAAPVALDGSLADARREDIEGFDGPAYFRTLVAVSVADGRVRQEERARLAVMLACAGVDAGLADALLAEARASTLAPLAHLPADLPEAFRERLFQDATIVALADEVRVPAEDALLTALAEHLALDVERVVPTWAWKAAGGVAAAPAGLWLMSAGATVAKAVGLGLAAGVGGFMLPAVLISGAGVGSLILSLSRQEPTS